ncbi:MAG: hypothetical protein IJV13_09580 [Prevotella sp.]|nr:hypothetical protein [Prevotella sp.]
MKRYIKPTTDVHQIEFMLMDPTSGLKQIDPRTTVDDPNLIEGKESGFGSFWSDGDEEE